mmetsp:Transcript_17771/g.41970  ORF Transcript_17771/g.41970 Transcript_17771/m.41970 type:complete len:218 (+) Transcript_17771:364-1017(+)
MDEDRVYVAMCRRSNKLCRPLGTADGAGLLGAQPLVDALQMEAVVARPPFQGTVVAGILHSGRYSLEGVLADPADVVFLLAITTSGASEFVGPGGRTADVPAPPGNAVKSLDVYLQLGRGFLLALPGRGRPRPPALPRTLGGAGLRWVGGGSRRLLCAAAVFGIHHLDVVVQGSHRLAFPIGSRHICYLLLQNGTWWIPTRLLFNGRPSIGTFPRSD